MPLVIVAFCVAVIRWPLAWVGLRSLQWDNWLELAAAGVNAVDGTCCDRGEERNCQHEQRPIDPVIAAPSADDPYIRLAEYLLWLRRQPPVWLDAMRERLERSEYGSRAMASSPDRRLYAVLQPTNEENVLRISNVLLAMGPQEMVIALDRVTRVGSRHE